MNGNPVTEQEKDRIVSCYQDGQSVLEVARAVHRHKQIVYRALRERGVTLRPKRYVRRERHGNWTGGTHVDSQGYVNVTPDLDDQIAAAMTNVRGTVRESRLVMAKHLGRPLRSNETVHHKNGDRADNRLENLQLRNGHHGAGQVWRCENCGSTNCAPTALG